MSMDFSADEIAFFVSGIILLNKATESDNWLTFSPLSSKDL
ncbi:20118_t:CDS:1, partial [Funneliformis geosporum]